MTAVTDPRDPRYSSGTKALLAGPSILRSLTCFRPTFELDTVSKFRLNAPTSLPLILTHQFWEVFKLPIQVWRLAMRAKKHSQSFSPESEIPRKRQQLINYRCCIYSSTSISLNRDKATVFIARHGEAYYGSLPA